MWVVILNQDLRLDFGDFFVSSRVVNVRMFLFLWNIIHWQGHEKIIIIMTPVDVSSFQKRPHLHPVEKQKTLKSSRKSWFKKHSNNVFCMFFVEFLKLFVYQPIWSPQGSILLPAWLWHQTSGKHGRSGVLSTPGDPSTWLSASSPGLWCPLYREHHSSCLKRQEISVDFLNFLE